MSIRTLLKRPAYFGLTFFSYVADSWRYTSHAAVLRLSDSPKKLEALIRKDCHRLEKGLALPSPRAWFGLPVLTRLLKNLGIYNSTKQTQPAVFGEVNAVLQAYEGFFSSDPQPEPIRATMNAIRSLAGSYGSGEGGVITQTRMQAQEYIGRDIENFVNTRYSVRNFTGDPVSDEDVREAISFAKKTPSVCNRCGWKIYFSSQDPIKASILKLQNGNAGFGHTSGGVIVVAMDLRSFEGAGERNQAYVDGGLFAMNLVHGLHNRGIASCFLNWSSDYFQDRRLRSLLDIPSHEIIVTLIGVGHYLETFRVAISPRPQVEDIFVNLNGAC